MSTTDDAVAVAGCSIVFLSIMFFGVILGALLWPYSINSWLAFLNEPETVLWWHGALLGCIPYFNRLAIPVAVITFFLMLII